MPATAQGRGARRTPGEEVLDGLRLVDRRPIPDHQQLAGDVAGNPHHVRGTERAPLHLPAQLPIGCQPPIDREVIPCQDGLQDRRPSPRRPSADHCRERIEAGLVYPDDDALCLLCFA
jgi:hypothetical protein